MEDNISIMSLGNTQGAMFAVKKMKVSNGGSGGRIITTASVLGLQVGSRGRMHQFHLINYVRMIDS